MKKFLLYILLGMCAAIFSGCEIVEQPVERQKPTRETDEAQARASWIRPQSWEGGLPGMMSNAPRQY